MLRRNFLGLIGAVMLGCMRRGADATRGREVLERNKMDSLPTKDELNYLSDSLLRGNVLGSNVLVISERFFGDSLRFDNYEWENIRFVNCDFVGVSMFGGVLKNVKFEGCGFVGGRWEDKSWETVTFDNCGGRGAFTLYAENGKDVLYNECCMLGGGNDRVINENDYCVLGSPGSCRLERCEISSAIIKGARRLLIKNSSISNVIVDDSVGDGAIFVIDGCKGEGRLTVASQKKAESVVVEKCVFNVVDFSCLSAIKLVVSGTVGAFDLYGSELDDVFFSDVIFRKKSGKNEAGGNWGLRGGGMVKKIFIDGCKQEGDGRVDLSGDYYPKGKGGSVPDYNIASSIVVRRSSLEKCDFSVMKIRDMSLENVELKSCRFYKSEISQLDLYGVGLDGEVDFTEAKVGSVRSAGVVRGRQLRIIKERGQVDL